MNAGGIFLAGTVGLDVGAAGRGLFRCPMCSICMQEDRLQFHAELHLGRPMQASEADALVTIAALGVPAKDAAMQVFGDLKVTVGAQWARK